MMDYIFTHKDIKFTWAPTPRCYSSWKPHHGVELGCHWEPAQTQMRLLCSHKQAKHQSSQDSRDLGTEMTIQLLSLRATAHVKSLPGDWPWLGKEQNRGRDPCQLAQGYLHSHGEQLLRISVWIQPSCRHNGLEKRMALFCSKQVSSVLQAQKKPRRTSFLFTFHRLLEIYPKSSAKSGLRAADPNVSSWEGCVQFCVWFKSCSNFFYQSQLQGSCKPKEIWDIHCICSIHTAKACWKAEAFLFIL